MIFSVSTAAELTLAAQYASGGDVISLASGTYSDVTLKSLQFNSAVTITSADPGNPAVLTDFTITSVKGLVLQNLSVKVGDGIALSIGASENIVVDNVDVSAGMTGGKPGGSGLKIDKSTNVTVKDSNFHDLGYGLTHVDSKNIDITGNTFENIRVDGIRGGGTSHIEISGNTLSNFFRDPGEHGDAIQFWTMGTTGSAHDIVVKDNLIYRGDGNRMQGIFFGDESKGAKPYINVEITGNTVLGAMYNGINLYPAKNAVISNNTVLGYEDMRSWIRVDGSTDVIMSKNVATQYSIPATGNVGLVRTDNVSLGQISAASDDKYINAFIQKQTPVFAASDAVLAQKVNVGSIQGTVEVTVGTSAANDITGTAGRDLIDGGKGDDTMTGGAGNDIYVVDSTKDSVREAVDGGVDTAMASASTYKLNSNVENLTLTANGAQTGTGNTLDNVIRANKVQSKLIGDAGNDTLVSVGGVDTMTGGAGADMFRFDAMPSKTATITDFVQGTDKLDFRTLLDAYQGRNPLADGWMKVEASPTGAVTVLIDSDGSAGPATFTAVTTLTGVKALTASDWIF